MVKRKRYTTSISKKVWERRTNSGLIEVSVWLDDEEYKQLLQKASNVSTYLMMNIDEELKPILKASKKETRHHLRKNRGVDKGIYKKHISIEKAKKRDPYTWEYKIGGKKGKYRLTHLLEKGHRIKSHGTFTGRYTRPIPHIVHGQDVVNKRTLNAVKKAIIKSFEEA